jgi:hypothetical protein
MSDKKFKVVNTTAGVLITRHGKLYVDNPNQDILEKLYQDGSIYVALETPKEIARELPKEEKVKKL